MAVRFRLPAHYMKYVFFVQSEGRGHLTQALTVKSKLEKRGHQVTAIIIGQNKNGLPGFFQEKINAPIFFIDSPNFVLDKDGQGIKTVTSVLVSLRRSPDFFRSLKKISQLITELSPDALISFYEPLAGIYARIYRDKRPLYCIGHQYFIAHPSFLFPQERQPERRLFEFFNRLSAPKRSIKIALSFTSEADQTKNNLFIVPPLIRPEILEKKPTAGDFLLIYLLNPGYQKQIINWSLKNPHIKIEAFSLTPPNQERSGSECLTWHGLSGQKFIDRLTICRAYISTAGFDSIAEAAYLGKNIMMVPTKNHYEQLCNATDAKRAGLAISSEHFDISLMVNKKQNTHPTIALRAFREWVDNNSDKITGILEGNRAIN